MTRIQLEHFKEQMDAAVKDNSEGCAGHVLRIFNLLTKWKIDPLLPDEFTYSKLRNLWRDNPEAAHVLADTHFLTKSK